MIAIHDPSEPLESERVDKHFACPGCGEDRMDSLAFVDDAGDIVHCTTCGVFYNPLARYPPPSS